MPRSFRRISRYTGVYDDIGDFYGNYLSSQGLAAIPGARQGRAAPVRVRDPVSYGWLRASK
jgi:hypothetical protein